MVKSCTIIVKEVSVFLFIMLPVLKITPENNIFPFTFILYCDIMIGHSPRRKPHYTRSLRDVNASTFEETELVIIRYAGYSLIYHDLCRCRCSMNRF